MKKFIIQVFSFLGFCLAIALIIFYSADGHADGIYLKFTTPKKSSLILGTSKAAQGLHPSVFNEVLGTDDMYNYAFSVIHSPYGPAYLRSIKNKLDTSKKGTFIVTVDPHSIASRNEDPDDSLKFRENESPVGEIENVTSSPNFEYLTFHYPEQYIYLLTRKIKYVSQGKVHDDGWVATNLPAGQEMVDYRTRLKIKSYTNQVKKYKFSQTRLEYLEKTISFLKEHGDVYLVRLPVVEPILELENSIVPDFEEKINKVADRHGVEYLNLTVKPDEYTYDDGNHLDKESGIKISREIAEWIKSLRSQNEVR